MKREKRLWNRLFICFSFMFMMSICYIYYNKYENAKYAYNRNCYYRMDSILLKTENMIKELHKVNESSTVSKESILKLKYLQNSIRSEMWYLNLEVNDYEWKIDKVDGFNSGSGFYGVILDTYFNYIEEEYDGESYLDLRKEGEALKFIYLYYKTMKDIINKEPAGTNFEEKYKQDIIIKAAWINMVSNLNKFDQDFANENRNIILANLN